jgi:predicted O-linked N-acetylglucosamine transferase (SPINDLY family)
MRQHAHGRLQVNAREASYRLMLWKLISGLLDAWRKRKRDAKSPRRDSDSATRRTGGDNGGKAAGSSLEDLVRQAEMLAKSGQLNAALECYRACVQTYPQGLSAYLGMGNMLVDLWSVEEVVATYGKALALAPHSSAIFSALLFHSHYLATPDQKRMFALHRRFGEMMRKASSPGNDNFALAGDPERRIRVGYLSPNFSRHSVGYFAEPVIRHHDRSHYEIYCYHTHQLSDETTERIRGLADGWRHIADADDDAVEQMIRNDCIDILMDLAGHSKGNRLGVFAKKPAPIQMTWLGYPDTTGLDAVDYRITDRVADPEPDAAQWHTERLLRIEDVFLCYQPPEDSPPVTARTNPASGIVFSSCNNIAKLNEQTIRVWGKILGQLPGSRIIVKSAPLGYPDTVDRVLDCFERNGIDTERIELRGWIADRRQHLELYANIDIALDTFPYNGTTTTCEALWMGVPVVSLAGTAHMSRVGATILRCAGLNEFVAGSMEEYADIAIAIAHDQTRRKSLRAGLRDKLLASPLLDHAGFTRKLERHFRQSWAAWCNRQRAGC